MKKVDADHMKSRVIFTGDPEKDKIAEALVTFIDGEPECSDEIHWLPSKKDIKTKQCHSVRIGVACDRCGNFEDVEKRYCSGCGGKFNGELTYFKEVSERLRRRKFKWQ